MAAALPTPVPHVPPVVAFGALLTGAFLIWTAVTGRSPRTELVAALRGGTTTGAPLATSSGTAVAPAVAGPVGIPLATSGETITAKSDARLEPVSSGLFLRHDAAAAFRAWSAAFGVPIPITDAWRDPQVQARQHEADPDRFASAEGSAHPKGLAVDANLTVLAANPNGNAAQRATWQRLYSSAMATGWYNPRGPYAGDHKEPWHFSYGRPA